MNVQYMYKQASLTSQVEITKFCINKIEHIRKGGEGISLEMRL